MTVAANVRLAGQIAVEIEYQKDFVLDGLIEDVKHLGNDIEDVDEVVRLADAFQELATACQEMAEALNYAAEDADVED
jgi:hypothetical protein